MSGWQLLSPCGAPPAWRPVVLNYTVVTSSREGCGLSATTTQIRTNGAAATPSAQYPVAAVRTVRDCGLLRPGASARPSGETWRFISVLQV